MSGSTTTNQTQTQNSQTSPWSAAMPALSQILGQLGKGNFSPTSGQSGAVNQIMGEAAGTPNFGGQGIGAVNNLFGSNTNPQQQMLNNSYGQVQGALSPYLNSNYTNPGTNPYLGSELATVNNDVTNSVAGQFAAAGRPLGTNADSAQAVARGVSQGESGILANEYNTLSGNQLTAAGDLNSAAGNTAAGVTGQQQAALQNQQQGISAAGSIPGLLTQPGSTNLSASTLGANLPWLNLGAAEGLANPLAGLGSQSTGTTTGVTSQQSPWYTTAIGAGLGGVGLLGGTGAFGNSGWLSGAAGSMFSDERVKENVSPIGKLYDETPVYSYNYIGDDVPRIGLMAQDVEKDTPEAVTEIGGIKAVNYGVATERARVIGMLGDMAMAA